MCKVYFKCRTQIPSHAVIFILTVQQQQQKWGNCCLLVRLFHSFISSASMKILYYLFVFFYDCFCSITVFGADFYSISLFRSGTRYFTLFLSSSFEAKQREKKSYSSNNRMKQKKMCNWSFRGLFSFNVPWVPNECFKCDKFETKWWL